MARDPEEEEMSGFTEVRSRSLQQGNIPLESDAEVSAALCTGCGIQGSVVRRVMHGR